MQPHYINRGFWVVTLCAAAISDLRSFRIPNVFPAILILLFVVPYSLGGFSEHCGRMCFISCRRLLLAWHFSAGLDWRWRCQVYAAAALWFNWGAVTLIFADGVAGLLLASLLRPGSGLRKNVPKEDRRIPYGVAIAAGAIMTAWSGWALYSRLQLIAGDFRLAERMPSRFTINSAREATPNLR